MSVDRLVVVLLVLIVLLVLLAAVILLVALLLVLILRVSVLIVVHFRYSPLFCRISITGQMQLQELFCSHSYIIFTYSPFIRQENILFFYPVTPPQNSGKDYYRISRKAYNVR